MPFDDHKNLAISNVETAPAPATSGTTLTVASGHGTRFPTVPFNATIWPRNQMPDPDNAEIVRVTNITGDTFTIVRAQEGTVARAIHANDQIANTITDKVIEDIETAISNIISAGGGGVSVISAELASVDSRVTSVNSRATSIESHVDTVSAVVAAVEVHASAASAAATSADAHASAASAAATSIGTLHSVLSDRVTSISAQLTSLEVHASAASAAATSIGTLHGVLSDRVTSISAQLTSLEVHASAASAAATSVLNMVQGVSTRSALSATVSTKGLQSALNALSNRISLNAKAISDIISAGGGGVSVTSNEVSVLIAAISGNTLSLQNVDASAVSAGTPVYVFTSANTFKKADASAVGTELVIGLVAQNSIAVSATGVIKTAGKITLTSAQWDDVASTTGGLTPGTVYYLHTLAGRITNTAPTGSAVVHPIGQALSPTEMQLMLTPWDDSTSVLSALSAAIVSVDGRVTSVNTALSGISARTTAGTSIHGLQSIFNALSNRISAGGGGAGSVTSTELSAGLAAVSAQAASALADAKSVGSTTASNLLSNINAISNFLSGLSGRSALSAGVSTHGLQSVINALSNRISINAKAISDMISAGGGGVSVTSNELSAAIASVAVGHFLSLQNVDASAVSAGTPVYAFTSANTFKEANASAAGAELVIGLVAATAIAVSAVGRIQTAGKMSLTSTQWGDITGVTTGLTPGDVYYLGTSAGTLTTAAPTSGVVHVVGQALSPNEMQLMLSPWDDATSALSTFGAAITSINDRLSGIVALNSAGTSVFGLQSVVNALSSRIAATGATTAFVCALVAGTSAQAASALAEAVSAGSATASNLLSNINAMSAAHASLSVRSVGNVSTHGFQSILNALSNRISAGGGGGGSVTSAELSASVQVASAAATSVNARVTSLNTFLGSLSVVSVTGSGSVNGLQSILNNLSNRLSGLYASAVLNISALSVGGVSTEGLQSAINALSNRISAVVAGTASATSQEVSALVQTASAAATSADAHANAASAAATSIGTLHSILSDRVTSISAQLTSLEVHASAASAAATSVDARVASLSAAFASLSVRTSIGGATSVHGLQSIINALSNQNSATFDFLWQRVGARQLQNLDSVTVSAGVPVYAHTSADTFKVANASAASPADRVIGLVNWGSIAVSAFGDVQFNGLISLAASVWDSRTGGTGGLTPGDTYYLGTSAGTLTTAAPSTARIVGTALDPNLMVLRIGADTGGGGGGSVTSAELADAISVGSTTASNLLSHIELLSGKVVSISAQLVSLETHASTASAAATSVDLRLDSVRSAIVNASAVASIAALSLAIANDASVSAAISTHIQSVLSANYGLGQVRALGTGTAAVSATSFTKISGMSISLAANAWYHIQGRAIFTLSAVQGTTFGFVYPGTNNMTTDSYMTMACLLTVMAAGPSGSIFTTSILPMGRITGANMSTVATANLSIGFGTSATLYTLEIDGLVNTGSATGATGVELMVKQSATGSGVFVHPGSYVRSYKVT